MADTRTLMARYEEAKLASESMKALKKELLDVGDGEITNKNEWYTPVYITNMAKKVLGTIELDPCTSISANNSISATTIYTKDDDGLSYYWQAKTMWMNPPFSPAGELYKWVQKAVTAYKYRSVKEMIILTPSSTDTVWASLLERGYTAFTYGRIRFCRPDGFVHHSPTSGHRLTYFGHKNKRFKEVLKSHKPHNSIEVRGFWFPNDD